MIAPYEVGVKLVVGLLALAKVPVPPLTTDHVPVPTAMALPVIATAANEHVLLSAPAAAVPGD